MRPLQKSIKAVRFDTVILRRADRPDEESKAKILRSAFGLPQDDGLGAFATVSTCMSLWGQTLNRMSLWGQTLNREIISLTLVIFFERFHDSRSDLIASLLTVPRDKRHSRSLPKKRKRIPDRPLIQLQFI